MLDGQETYTSAAATTDGAVTVALTGVGDVARTVQFQPLISSTLLSGLPGQITPAVDITADAPFDTARITMRFDPAQVPNGDVDNLRILYYDAADRVFKPTDGAYGVDAAAGIAWAETSHFTPFVLFSIPNWNSVWEYTMAPGRDSTDPVTTSLDVMLVLDSSGSMTRNDPQDLRKTAAKNFIDALLVGDQVGVVDFDSSATLLQSLTPLTETAKAAVDQIDSSGGTCIGDGIALATQEIVANSGADRLKAQIVLTDGEDSPSCNPDYAALLTAAGDAGIQIYTIGLGTDVDTALLQQMADDTGGQYFPISNADDLPEVFRRIAEGPDPDQDTDGDGLPDWLETQGIRRGNGTIVTTDPNNVDTDGDGLSDAEEVGTLQTGPDGDYYDGLTDPTNADTDGDGLIDSDEIYGITDPTNADTDSDGLSDSQELFAGFDATNANPDGDTFGDAEEFARDSDPFYYNLTGWEYAAAVVAGVILGDAGQNMVDLGLLNSAYLQCFGYIGGWLASGFFVIGDIRDTLASLIRLDAWDTLLNALAIIPLLGDGSKVVRVVAKYLEWFADLRPALGRWLFKQFADAPDIRQRLVRLLRYTDELSVFIARSDADELIAAGNDMSRIADVFIRNGDKFKLSTKASNSINWSDIDSRVSRHWPGVRGGRYAQARSTEAAVEFLTQSNYDVLFVGGRSANYPTNVGVGPDIVAVNRSTGKTVVVEVKGNVKANAQVVNLSRMQSTVNNQALIENSVRWLSENPQRYLNTLQGSTDPDIQRAGDLLEQIANGTGSYETVIFVSGRQPSRWGNGMADVFEALEDSRITAVEFIKLPWP